MLTHHLFIASNIKPNIFLKMHHTSACTYSNAKTQQFVMTGKRWSHGIYAFYHTVCIHRLKWRHISPFCGNNTTQCVELKGEDLSCYSNKIESVSLRKCPHDHRLNKFNTNKAYLSTITVTNISRHFTHQMAAKSSGIDMKRLLRHCRPMYYRHETYDRDAERHTKRQS